jgi:hypothetical protein
LNNDTATDAVLAGTIAATVGIWEGGKWVFKKANTWWKNGKCAGGKSQV